MYGTVNVRVDVLGTSKNLFFLQVSDKTPTELQPQSRLVTPQATASRMICDFKFGKPFYNAWTYTFGDHLPKNLNEYHLQIVEKKNMPHDILLDFKLSSVATLFLVRQ